MEPNAFFEAAFATLREESSFDDMTHEVERLDEAVHLIVFDPRFNSVNWMFDCFQLAKEIVYSYCWMVAHADAVSQTGSDADFYIQYYADNCITRINSFRDKAALLAWSYYCAFNPNNRAEVLGFSKVVERLRHPVRFGLVLKDQDAFVTQLEKLQGSCFERMTSYRHLKIHRIEPKILMRPPQRSDGLSYMVPLFDEKEIKNWKEKLEAMYPDDNFRKGIEKGCYKNGVLFDRIPVRDEFWCYTEVAEATQKCVHVCIDVARALSQILRERVPLGS